MGSFPLKAAFAAFFLCMAPMIAWSGLATDLDSKVLIRAAYKLHSSKGNELVVNSLTDAMWRLSGCYADRSNLAAQIRQAEHPRDLAEYIRHIPAASTSACPASSENATLVFASETGAAIESSLGHVFLLLERPNNPMFSEVVGFSAVNFVDPETEKPSFANYMKGAFGELEGAYSSTYFFDVYADSVMRDQRTLLQYEIDELKVDSTQLKLAITSKKGSTHPYNFFVSNCSVELLSLLRDIAEIDSPIKGFTPPIKHIEKLKKSEVLMYAGAYTPENSGLPFYTSENQEVITNRNPSRLSLGYDGHEYSIDYALFDTDPSELGSIANGKRSTWLILSSTIDRSPNANVTVIERKRLRSLGSHWLPSTNFLVAVLPNLSTRLETTYDAYLDPFRISGGVSWSDGLMSPLVKIATNTNSYIAEITWNGKEITGHVGFKILDSVTLHAQFTESDHAARVSWRF